MGRLHTKEEVVKSTAAPPRTLFIGDVHGCSAELDRLLERCGHVPTDRVVFLGDLVAKGSDSAGVVARARALGALGVLGNHDAHVLRRREASGASRRELKAEHRQVLDTLSDEDFAYLAALPLFLRFPEWNVAALHAGALAGTPLERQDREQLLHLRSIGPGGEPLKRADGGVPWASLWTGPERLVFGHDARRKLQRHSHALGLDTGCVYGGRLTAWILPDDELVSVEAERVHFPPE